MHIIRVADVMTRDPVCITPSTNLLECAKQMVRKRVGSLLIVNNKKLVGFISQKDILWALIKKSRADLSKIKAIDISPRKLATLRPLDTIEDAIKKMKKTKFERLPVIHENELVGIVTLKDILNFNPEIYHELDELAEIREEELKLERVEKAKSKQLKNEGSCEECGNFDILFEINGMAICEACKNLV